MSNEYYQCCYTNAELNIGGVVSSGWQAVAVSPGLPSSVMNTCTGLQNVNSSIKGPMRDEMGQVLDLFEVHGDGNFVYALHSKYGMVDRLGRPNMFSHAYIFNWNMSGALKDPNVFLSLEASNYKDNLQDAETQTSPLVYLDALDIDKALAIAGMSQQTYLTLIRCVYAKMTERSMTQPLYVAYDGSATALRAVLYCIYRGLPYCLRRRLSMASAPSNGAAKKDLVFSIHAKQKQLWVSPQTGENSVLNPRLVRKISRYGFADYAVANMDSVDEDAYFEKLERTAVDLGDSSASDLLVLKIAHTVTMCQDIKSLNDAALEGRISDALRSRPFGNNRMDGYIASLLEEVVKREMTLTDACEEDLAAKVSKTQSEELQAADENYAIYRFSTLPVDDAARKLKKLDDRTLNRYASRLCATPRGIAILDSYYAHFVLAQPNLEWATLNAVMDSIGEGRISTYSLTRPRLFECAGALYEAGLKEPGNIVKCYEYYIAFLSRILSENQVAVYDKAARRKYWQAVSYATFDFDALDTYIAMKNGSNRSNTSVRLSVLGRKELRGIGGSDGRSEDEALKEVFAFFQDDFRDGFDTDQERMEAANALCDYVLRTYEGFDSQFGEWFHVAAEAPTYEVLNAVICTRDALNGDDFDGVIKGFNDLLRLARGSQLERMKQLNKTVAELVCNHCIAMEQTEMGYQAPLDLWLVVGRGLHSNVFKVFNDYDAAVLHTDDIKTMLSSSKCFGVSPYEGLAAEYARTGRHGKTVDTWTKVAKKMSRQGNGFFGILRRGDDDRYCNDRRDTLSSATRSQDFETGFDMQWEGPRKKGRFGIGRGGR